jgi:hypothetical protein
VVWLATPPSSAWCMFLRRKSGLSPTTLLHERCGGGSKILSSVEMQETYQRRLEARAAAAKEAAPELDDDGDVDEKSYLKVKAKLIEGAASGNPKYMDLYFKTYGKPFVEEEAAARTTDLVALDLDELIVRTVSLLDPKSLAKELAELGWVVVPPGGNGDEH